MTETPDYEKYTTAELTNEAALIDRSRHPQDWLLIEAELSVRAARGEDVLWASFPSYTVTRIAWCSALGFFVVPLLTHISIFLFLPRYLTDLLDQNLPFGIFFLLGWLLGAVVGESFQLRASYETHWLGRLSQCLQGAALGCSFTPLLGAGLGVVLVLLRWFQQLLGL